MWVHCIECITGKCTKCNGIITPAKHNGLDQCEKVVIYNQFETRPYETNKKKSSKTDRTNGEKDSDTGKRRTERIPYNTAIK